MNKILKYQILLYLFIILFTEQHKQFWEFWTSCDWQIYEFILNAIYWFSVIVTLVSIPLLVWQGIQILKSHRSRKCIVLWTANVTLFLFVILETLFLSTQFKV